jgi:hypothetical protein
MSGFDGLAQNPGRFGSALNSEEWQEIQLFKFGLMSFLLPRNLFMLEGDPILYDSCMQWKKNNALPSQANGQPFTSWAEVQRVLGCGENATDSGNNFSSEEEAFLLYNQFSQAVCARWMENFKGIVIGGKEFYGISTAEGEHNNSYIKVNYNMDIYSPGDAASNSSSQQYILNYMTIHDPWENDFYYYSPPPYQSYRLWSAGPNQKTFPPWMNIEDLQVSDRQTVLKWMADDIVFMNALGNFTFTIVQDAGDTYISVENISLIVGFEGGTITNTVKSNTSWTVINDADWLTINPLSGEGNNVLTITVNPNTTSTNRDSVVNLLTVDNKVITFTVYQRLFVPQLTVYPSSLTFDADGGEQKITISSNSNWIINAD